jgi:FeS assembly SUF system protein
MGSEPTRAEPLHIMPSDPESISKLTDWLNAAPEVPPNEDEELRGRIVDALREIYDPEIPVNIYDLNLIYAISVDERKAVDIQMTLTAPACPVADMFPGWVETRVGEVEGVSGARVELVWDPPWTPDMLSDEIKLELGLL